MPLAKMASVETCVRMLRRLIGREKLSEARLKNTNSAISVQSCANMLKRRIQGDDSCRLLKRSTNVSSLCLMAEFISASSVHLYQGSC